MLPRLGLRRELGAQPPQGALLKLIVISQMAFVVPCQHCGKVESTDEVLQGSERLRQACLYGLGIPAAATDCMVLVADPPFHEVAQCPALGACPGSDVAH